jgi:hypothetical protein
MQKLLYSMTQGGKLYCKMKNSNNMQEQKVRGENQKAYLHLLVGITTFPARKRDFPIFGPEGTSDRSDFLQYFGRLTAYSPCIMTHPTISTRK